MKRAKSKNEMEIKLQQFDQEEEETAKEPSIAKDYLSLKSKGGDKGKKMVDDGQVSILTEYTKEKYKEYIAWLSQNIKGQPPYRSYPADMVEFLELGRNICLYGVGSKREYLTSLNSNFFPTRHTWEVKGYLSSINQKKVFSHFGKFLTNAKFAQTIEKISIKDLLVEYKEILEMNKTYITIIFHCLDGQNFLNSQSQSKLSDLFSLPYIQLICSIDNAKIVRHWHPKTKEKLNLLFYNINTKIPNIEEQYYKQHTNEKKDSSQKSLMNIWLSLNRNQKKILKIFARRGLDNIQRQEQEKFTVTNLLQECIEEVILSNEVQLRENLLQLLDHKVIEQKMDESRMKKVLSIKKYEKRLLQKILDMKVQ